MVFAKDFELPGLPTNKKIHSKKRVKESNTFGLLKKMYFLETEYGDWGIEVLKNCFMKPLREDTHKKSVFI